MESHFTTFGLLFEYQQLMLGLSGFTSALSLESECFINKNNFPADNFHHSKEMFDEVLKFLHERFGLAKRHSESILQANQLLDIMARFDMGEFLEGGPLVVSSYSPFGSLHYK